MPNDADRTGTPAGVFGAELRRKSSYSGSNGGDCVEVGTARRAVSVRDSKDPQGPRLAFAADAWTAFAEHVKAAA
jgi:uncharacterized protein DUF397